MIPEVSHSALPDVGKGRNGLPQRDFSGDLWDARQGGMVIEAKDRWSLLCASSANEGSSHELRPA